MLRFLVYLAILAAFTFGLVWAIDHPGTMVINWQGTHVEISLLVALTAILVFAVAVAILWTLLRFFFRLPSIFSRGSRTRRRNKGFAALSRGMVAAGAGDARGAQRAADDAQRFLPGEPLSLLLKAQAAQLSGDRDSASKAFTQMLEKPETRLLGLRGLHIEARRRGDDDGAHDFARQAHHIAPVPWAGQAVLEHKTAKADWQGALATVEANIAARSIDRKSAARQKAVLQTAIALDKAATEPDAALQLARDALKAAPDLVPAAALAGRLLARRGDIRKASRLIETAWTACPHPDLAKVYLDVRPGDSTSDRFARAKNLFRLKPREPESRLMMAKAALENRDFAAARAALLPLADGETRPTARTCLLMAQLEETEKGAAGPVREWLARASRAPRDMAWVADGAVSDTWSPVSPVTGQIDAFQWRTPLEQLSAHMVDWQPAQMPVLPAEEIPVVEAAPVIEPPGLALAARAAPAPLAALEAPAPLRAITLPVVFPRPAEPDDPGLLDESEKPRFGFLPRT